MNPAFSEDMSNEFVETFKMVDTEGEGKITGEQFLLAAKALGLDNDPRMYQRACKPEKVDLKEFISLIHLCTNLSSAWVSNELQETVEVFDKDNGVCFGVANAKRVFSRIGEKLTDVVIEEQIHGYEDLDENMMIDAASLGKILVAKEGK